MGKEARVYLDVSIGGSRVGRVEIQLFAGLPKTTENFRSLCTGERGLGRTTGKALHYRKVPFHRVIKGFMLQSGDFSQRNGTGGESIYGGKFEDEGFRYRHTKAGLLSMANAGKNTNGSQFFITTAPTPHLDGKHVVFGEVIRGMDVVCKIENVETVANDKPASMQTVVIEDCGELDGESDSGSSSDEEAPDERKRRKALKKEKKRLKKQEKKEKKRVKKEVKRAKKEAKKRQHDEDGDAKMHKRHRRDEDRGRSWSRDGDKSNKRDGWEQDERRKNSRSPSRSKSRVHADSRPQSHRDPTERKHSRSCGERGGSRSPSNSRSPRSSRETPRCRGDNGYTRTRRSLSRERHQRHSRSRSRSLGRSNARGGFGQRSDRRHRSRSRRRSRS